MSMLMITRMRQGQALTDFGYSPTLNIAVCVDCWTRSEWRRMPGAPSETTLGIGKV